MNIKHYLSAFAALAMLAACSDYDPGMSDQAVDLTDAQIETIKEYSANFVQRYGEMDPNHTWGFGELAELEEMGTRAVQTERNLWASVENGEIVTHMGTYQQTSDPYNSPMEYTTKAGWTVPGFPSSVDNLYHMATDDGPVQTFDKENAISALATPGNQLKPIGDVTDEEIEYVSWWFRTHPGPTNTVPQFTEYFVQDISQDFDRDNYPDGNWKDMNANKDKRLVPVILHKTDGTTVNETPEAISYGMDYFSVQTSDGSWEHNNNFNKGKANPIAESAPATATDTTALTTSTTTYPNRTLKYWTSEGPFYNQQTNTQVYKSGSGYTTSFSYHNSDDNTDYQRYKLVHLKFYGPRTGKLYEGYYLGFDYELHKRVDVGNGEYKTTDINADGYYSNWIVKISPADPNFYNTRTRTISRRVMCEDLGETDDFDFNDIVFDVVYTRQEKKNSSGNWEAVGGDTWTGQITILASGGTLPIYIENFDGEKYEAHTVMGGTMMSESLYNPINVGTGLVKPAVTLTAVSGLTSTNPDNVHIYVYKADGTPAGKDITYPERVALQKFGENPAPQKICMPTDVRWLKERKQIETAYPHFRDWVNSERSDFGFGNDHDWTRTDVNESPLY